MVEDSSGLHFAEVSILAVLVETTAALEEQSFSFLDQVDQERVCEDSCFFSHLLGECAHSQLLGL